MHLLKYVDEFVYAISYMWFRGTDESRVWGLSLPSTYISVSDLFVDTKILKEPGPRLNIKTVLSMYGDFHVKDKTAAMTSYL